MCDLVKVILFREVSERIPRDARQLHFVRILVERCEHHCIGTEIIRVHIVLFTARFILVNAEYEYSEAVHRRIDILLAQLGTFPVRPLERTVHTALEGVEQVEQVDTDDNQRNDQKDDYTV